METPTATLRAAADAYYTRLVDEYAQTPERARELVEAWLNEQPAALVGPPPTEDTTFFRVRGVPLALIERVRVFRARHRERTTGEIVTAALTAWLDGQEGA
jgi:hypothetical protein